MPYYDLKCTSCEGEFNIKAKMSEREDNLIKCPKCGSNKLSTLFKNVNIITSRKSDTPSCPNINKCGGCCGAR